MRGRWLAFVLALALGGCALPGWVPYFGKKKPEPEVARPATPAPETAPATPRPRPVDRDDVADRVVAVVNNDAITLGELQENIAIYRQENRGRVSASEEELQKQFLGRQKVMRRKVSLRISVTEQEIDRYVADNRDKLEAGLSYHARHILIVPDDPTDAGWEAARIRADVIRTQIRDGADFAELARHNSRDASAKDGGDLGILKRGELTQEIESRILVLGPGDLSPPFRSALGWHVFRLESKDVLEGEGLQRARQQVKEILYREKYEARLETWIKEMKDRAIIEVRM